MDSMNPINFDDQFELLIRAAILCVEFYKLPDGFEHTLQRLYSIAGTPDAESKELIKGWIQNAMMHVLTLQFPQAPSALLTVIQRALCCLEISTALLRHSDYEIPPESFYTICIFHLRYGGYAELCQLLWFLYEPLFVPVAILAEKFQFMGNLGRPARAHPSEIYSMRSLNIPDTVQAGFLRDAMAQWPLHRFSPPIYHFTRVKTVTTKHKQRLMLVQASLNFYTLPTVISDFLRTTIDVSRHIIPEMWKVLVGFGGGFFSTALILEINARYPQATAEFSNDIYSILSSPKVRKDIIGGLRSPDIQVNALYAFFSESFCKGGTKATREAINLVFGPLFYVAEQAILNGSPVPLRHASPTNPPESTCANNSEAYQLPMQSLFQWMTKSLSFDDEGKIVQKLPVHAEREVRPLPKRSRTAPNTLAP